MEVFLTHAYFLNDDPKEKEIMRPYPPLGLLYIAAYLDENKIPCRVFDSTFSEFDSLKKSLHHEQPEIVCMYVNLMTRLRVLDVIDFINKELPNTQIILGGPDVRYNAEELLDAGANYIIIGEGELSCFELVNALQEGRTNDIPQIQGLAFHKNNSIHFTDERVKIKSIDELPFPARHKIDLNAYQKVWRTHHGISTISISTMRGCPYTCKWCSRAVYGLSYRRRSPKLVVDEIEHIYNTYQPDSLWFVDDVFTVNHKWLRQFNAEIKKRCLKISYECISRADRMSTEVISLLKESGCFRVWIGAESGSQKVIDLMDRRVDVNQVRDMIIETRAAGIEAGTFIMLGYPGETEEDILETIHHLKTSNPNHFTITVAYPIKGTELFTEIEHKQTKNFNWTENTDRDRDFERAYNRKYYDYAVRRVVNEVKYYQKKLNKQQLSPSAARMKLNYKLASLGMWFERRRS